MTPDEFKEKFNVLDELKITYTGIGKKYFACFYQLNGDFVKAEPENKPSEEIAQMYSRRILAYQNISNYGAHVGISSFDVLLEWLDENWPKVVKK